MSVQTESKKSQKFQSPDSDCQRTRWGRIRDLPVSKSLAERLIRERLIESYAPLGPGNKRAPRLINLDSFDRWVRGDRAQEHSKEEAHK
jgi:hypothetical protein